MPEVLVTEPTATQNSLFLPLAVAETIAIANCTDQQTDGHAEWV